MKKIFVLALLLSIPFLAFAQYKDQAKLPKMSQAIAKPASSLLLGFLKSDRLTMHHNFSMSFMTLGRQNMMVNSYTNTINYQISNPLFLRMNLGVMNMPYSSFTNSALNNTHFFGGAELFYRPTDNTTIKLGIDVRPGYYYPGNYYDNYLYNDSNMIRDYYLGHTDYLFDRVR